MLTNTAPLYERLVFSGVAATTAVTGKAPIFQQENNFALDKKL